MRLAGWMVVLCGACGGESAQPNARPSPAPVETRPSPAPVETSPPAARADIEVDTSMPVAPDIGEAPPEHVPAPEPTPTGVAAVIRNIAPWLTGDLAGGQIHESEAGIAIDVAGPGPTTLEALFARARELGAALAEYTTDPSVGLVVRWAENQRMIAWLHHGDAGWRARGGAYGLVVADRADYRLATHPKVAYAVDYTQSEPYALKCSGEVENLTDAPLDVVVACRLWKTRRAHRDGDKPIVKTRTLAKLGPKKKRRFSIDIGRTHAGYEVEVQLAVGGDVVPYFNQYAWDEAQDFIATADGVIADTGLTMRSVSLAPNPLALHIDHKSPVFDAAEFARLGKARQQEIGARIESAFDRHYSRFHDSARPPYEVHEGQWRWYVSARGADPRD